MALKNTGLWPSRIVLRAWLTKTRITRGEKVSRVQFRSKTFKKSLLEIRLSSYIKSDSVDLKFMHIKIIQNIIIFSTFSMKGTISNVWKTGEILWVGGKSSVTMECSGSILIILRGPSVARRNVGWTLQRACCPIIWILVVCRNGHVGQLQEEKFLILWKPGIALTSFQSPQTSNKMADQRKNSIIRTV